MQAILPNGERSKRKRKIGFEQRPAIRLLFQQRLSWHHLEVGVVEEVQMDLAEDAAVQQIGEEELVVLHEVLLE